MRQLAELPLQRELGLSFLLYSWHALNPGERIMR